jgi:hypothetical protein
VKRTLLALLSLTSVSLDDFADDQYAQQPEVLARIAAAAQKHGSPLRSSIDENISYYLRSAEYIGPCAAPFGTVHVARLFFIRSAPQGKKLPARGHTFIVFLDHAFAVRDYWEVEHTLGRLSVSGSSLLLEDKVLFDYAHLPRSGSIIVDGRVQEPPVWK